MCLPVLVGVVSMATLSIGAIAPSVSRKFSSSKARGSSRASSQWTQQTLVRYEDLADMISNGMGEEVLMWVCMCEVGGSMVWEGLCCG